MRQWSVPKRCVIALLSELGVLVAFAMRVNLSVGLVAMVNSTYVEERSHSFSSECPPSSLNATLKATSPRHNSFNWDEKLQGIILSAFYFGYVFTQIPGGLLSRQIGGKWLFGCGILGTSLLTIATPIAAKTDVRLLIAVRVLEGLVEGVTLPAIHQLVGAWSPIYERTKMASFILTGEDELIFTRQRGAPVGTLITYSVSGILCNSDVLGGWPSAFYIFGASGVAWFLLWSIVAASSPEEDHCISFDEMSYIIMNRATHKKHLMPPVPWKQILLSKAVWALVISNICVSWFFYTCLTCLPLFYKEVLNFSIRENGFASALPYLLSFLAALVCGQIADFLRAGERLSTGAVRKIFAIVTFFPTSLLLISVGYVGCSSTAAVAVLAVAGGFLGSCNSGPCINDMDISPTFAGLLNGITNTGGTVAGILSPVAIGWITETGSTRNQWQKVFYMSSAISAFGGIIFLVFGSGDEQWWSYTQEEEDRVDENSNAGLIDT